MLKEHEWVRGGNVGLFDVSHMGQVLLEGPEIVSFLEKITPSSFSNLPNGQAKYTVLTNEEGGIIDDLIISKLTDDKFFVVINAGCKEKDIAWMKQNLPEEIKFNHLEDRSLIAIQGEKAEVVLNELVKDKNLADLPYMNIANFELKDFGEVYISRTGYTGEDGFEVSIKNDTAALFWQKLLENDAVTSIGLGARDSLRLEVGYPLYGHDLNDKTTPVESAISWVIGKEQKEFFGANAIWDHKNNGVSKRRMGVKLLGRGIAREGSPIEKDGKEIGVLTSGGFSPNLKCSIGQAYIDTSFKKGDKIDVVVRGRKIAAEIASFVFVKPRTKSLK